MVLRIENVFEHMVVPTSIASVLSGWVTDRSSKTKNVIRSGTSQLGEGNVSIEMGDGDLELRVVRILLLHETTNSGDVSDGRYIER